MSPGPFPERVDASKLFARHGRIDAVLPLPRLSRLRPLLADDDGQVEAVMQFGVDEEGNKLLTGELKGKLALVCQRCLDSMPFVVDCSLELLVFESRAELVAYQQSHGQDSLERDVIVLDETADDESALVDTNLDLLALVEDELLLSLPMAPMHDDEGCSEALLRLREQSEAAEQEAQAQVVSPFAVLAQLKKPK